MSLSLPENIANLKAVTAGDVAVIDAWAKSVHSGVTVTWDEERVAPPRRISGPHRGESIEQARARDPGPAQLTVRCVDARTKQRTQRRVAIHLAQPSGNTALLARIELATMQSQQQAAIAAHTLSDAVLLSGYSVEDLELMGAGKPPIGERSWDHLPVNAKHFDLLGELCAESIADPGYVEREKRIFELREIIRADWKGSLLEAVSTAAGIAQGVQGVGSPKFAEIRQAIERAFAKGV